MLNQNKSLNIILAQKGIMVNEDSQNKERILCKQQ